MFCQIKVITTVIFTACCVITVATCLPIARPFQSWPCQKDTEVRTLLSNALIRAQFLTKEITVLSSMIEKIWPTDLYKETSVDFIVPPGRFNKTANTSKEIFRVHFRKLKIFLSAIKNSMRQLNRLQDPRGRFINELGSMKKHTKARINHLQRIVKIIQRRGNNPTPRAPQRTNGTVNEPGNHSLASQTTQDVLLHTRVMLDEFYGHVLTLTADLWKYKRMACN